MDWGDSFKSITTAAHAAGIPLTDLPCVSTMIEPFDHLHFEWSAFGALSTDRQVGMDRGPIPWRSIHVFAERYGIVSDDFERLCNLIRSMDAAYLGYFKKDAQ